MSCPNPSNGLVWPWSHESTRITQAKTVFLLCCKFSRVTKQHGDVMAWTTPTSSQKEQMPIGISEGRLHTSMVKDMRVHCAIIAWQNTVGAACERKFQRSNSHFQQFPRDQHCLNLQTCMLSTPNQISRSQSFSYPNVVISTNHFFF